MNPSKMACEACKHEEHQWVLTDTLDSSVSYYLCGNCLPALVNYHLSKKQFRHLMKAGHTDMEFLLHEDFYDEEGRALQPMYEDRGNDVLL